MSESDFDISHAFGADDGERWDRSTHRAHEVTALDAVLSKLIPPRIGECALDVTGPTCMGEHANAVGAALGITASRGQPHEIVEIAKKKLNCDTERCVIAAVTRSGALSPHVVATIRRRLKSAGPTDATLLNNINIDTVLQQWAATHRDFFAFNFNMRDYASHSFKDGEVLNTPDTLATIDFADLYLGSSRYRCAACIVNSDVYEGAGKHWMALFADARGSEWTVEFFNSSGNAPAHEWINWMEKTKNRMLALRPGGKVSVIRATNIRQQHSKSECGVYSLFYVWARLNGVPASYFGAHRIADKFMFEFRQHIFYDAVRPQASPQFDWEAYQRNTKIKWDV